MSADERAAEGLGADHEADIRRQRRELAVGTQAWALVAIDVLLDEVVQLRNLDAAHAQEVQDLQDRLNAIGEALHKLNEHHTNDHHDGGEDMPVDPDIAWALILWRRPHVLDYWRKVRDKAVAAAQAGEVGDGH